MPAYCVGLDISETSSSSKELWMASAIHLCRVFMFTTAIRLGRRFVCPVFAAPSSIGRLVPLRRPIRYKLYVRFHLSV